MSGFAFGLAGAVRRRVQTFFRSGRVVSALLLLGLMAWAGPAASQTTPASPPGVPLRYLALNAGNFATLCPETKLCDEQTVENLRAYIEFWQPDVIMISEVMREAQLTGTENFGPVLPDGYDGKCGESRDRDTGELAAWDAANASHEHECVAWKTSRLSYVAGSALSAYGRNDTFGKENCGYDKTGFRVRLLLDGVSTVTAVTVHPDASNADCRTEEIGRYWSDLAGDDTAAIIGGDWNTEVLAELQVPDRFQVNYSFGQHWNLVTHYDEYSVVYGFGLVDRKIDHTFSTFGQPCTSCGATYGTDDLPYGSALGGYDGHPRADGGRGFDHRQILVDMALQPVDLIFVIDTTGSMADDIASVKSAGSRILDAVASVSPKFRVAVADYKDFPVSPYGGPGDYPYRADVPFSSDPAVIRAGLNSLSARGGGDTPEAVYSGLVHAIYNDGLGAWRDGVNKIVVVMGDAPPHDPEPFTGYTEAGVVNAAFSVDPAIIYPVVIGGDPSALSFFSRLADDTKGKTFTASDASTVVGALMAAISDIGRTPTANRPPVCTSAQPSVSLLWPPEHAMGPIAIQGVSDPDGDPVTVVVSGITQDEPVAGSGSGDAAPDGDGLGTAVARVRAERSGKGNGRVYSVSFVAKDDKGGQCTGIVPVCVPHDQRPGSSCTDDGQRFDSTGH